MRSVLNSQIDLRPMENTVAKRKEHRVRDKTGTRTDRTKYRPLLVLHRVRGDNVAGR